MGLLDTLERRLRRFAIHNLTFMLVIGQFVVTVVSVARPDLLPMIWLDSAKVWQGEIWRLFTFVVFPSSTSPLFVLFVLLFLWQMGTALENEWGAFRYNVFFFVGYLTTVAASFLTPGVAATNGYLLGSIFLAFAALYPEYQIMLFLVIPVRVKWLALFTWCLYGVMFVAALASGRPLQALLIVAAVLNWLLFFWRELLVRVRGMPRGTAKVTSRQLREKEAAFHTCTACGVTDKGDPKMEFRYCPQCAGTPCYCINHINAHAHRTTIA